jgi:deoxycytidylate deaminase
MEYLKGEKEEETKRWIIVAGEVAKKALCLRAQCGVVIVNKGEIIGEGYNAPPQDNKEARMCDKNLSGGKPRYDKTCCMHAEWRAILDMVKRNPEKVSGSTLYFTRINEGVALWGKPFCTVCSRLILDSGIGTVVLPQEGGLCSYGADEYNRVSYAYTP